LLSPFDLLHKASAAEVNPVVQQRLSWLAYRDVKDEGIFPIGKVEGQIPFGLRGTLYRNGPGQKLNHGVPLEHLFDGDSYITAFHFSKEGVTTRSQFAETTSRQEEHRSERMVYHDFGTEAPPARFIDLWHSHKISPSINVLPWDNRLLAFSEGGVPFALDPKTLQSQGDWTFHNTLSTILTGFTAHPKLDPISHDGYGYALSVRQNIWLEVFRMDKSSGKLVELYSYPLGGYYMTHDMMITKNYIVFVIGPLQLSITGVIEGRQPMVNLFHFDKNQPTRILIFHKDGRSKPIEIIEEQATVVFHHCNAYEDENTGRLVFHSSIYEDDKVLNALSCWGKLNIPSLPKASLTRVEIDLGKKEVVSRTKLFEGVRDFPALDPLRIGNENEYVYLLEAGQEFLTFSTLVCMNLKTGRENQVQASVGHAWGEPVFVPNPERSPADESDGWILHLGYDRHADETYLDIRRAITLDLLARVHAGRYFPLGFHGTFSLENNI
jgi:all-trans-8'-apo-beta-carotenal 15,15'-oxygenase